MVERPLFLALAVVFVQFEILYTFVVEFNASVLVKKKNYIASYVEFSAVIFSFFSRRVPLGCVFNGRSYNLKKSKVPFAIDFLRLFTR